MARKVAIVGRGMTKFGRRADQNFMDLLVDASNQAIKDAEIGNRTVDAVYVASMLAGELNNQTAVATALVDDLSLLPAAAERIENGPGASASAIKNAWFGIASEAYDVVLVAGAEKVRNAPGDRVTDLISTMTHPSAEYPSGVTLPSLGALFARLYMERYGVERKHLAMVAVKNHLNASKNPLAHLQRRITLEGIYSTPEAEMNNPIIADPLRLYDMSPLTDGGAALILCAAEKAKEFCEEPVFISGFGHATDTLALHQRQDPTTLKAVGLAAQQAFKMAKLTPKDIDVAELHDAFTILEIAESEDVGFFEKGTAHKAVEEGRTSLDGDLPINPSGGLKARGHPLGATGMAQAVELVSQLRGEAGERQVADAEKAFMCNFGGFGNNVLTFIFERGE